MPPRVLLYSHDTFGLGHLRRNLVIAEQLLARRWPFAVTLVTGSPVAATWPMPPGLQLRSMPAVVKTGAEVYAARDGSMSFAEVKARREQVLLDTIAAVRPDAVLVDHAPSGMKGELLPALVLLRARLPHSKIVLGLRDILDDSDTVCRLWQREGTYELIRAFYDRVLVYGSQDFFDVAERYQMPADIVARMRYCGHVARVANAPSNKPVLRSHRRTTVLVTVGGGGDGYDIIALYLRALEKTGVGHVRSIIITGPLMPEAQHHALVGMAGAYPNVTVTDATTDMPRLQAEADLVVGMAGYNSSVEILAARKPAILIPRLRPRMEQRLRAKFLAERGLVWTVEPDGNAVDTLAALLDRAFVGDVPASLPTNRLNLGGARNVADALAALIDTAQDQHAHDNLNPLRSPRENLLSAQAFSSPVRDLHPE